MEETMNLTAERSLEIITEQIERSRKSVSQDVGMTLLISGLCIAGVAIIVTVGELLTKNWIFYLLYMLIPIFIWAIERYVNRNKPKVPASVMLQPRNPANRLPRRPPRAVTVRRRKSRLLPAPASPPRKVVRTAAPPTRCARVITWARLPRATA